MAGADRIPDASRMVPVREAVTEREEAGLVVLVRVRFSGLRRSLVSAFGAEPDLTVRLDPLGSAAWRLIDGKRTVGDIRATLAQQFPAEPDLAVRLGRYLGMLASRSLIRLS